MIRYDTFLIQLYYQIHSCQGLTFIIGIAQYNYIRRLEKSKSMAFLDLVFDMLPPYPKLNQKKAFEPDE
ncbi:hypothetical protein C8N25_13048 [Algoriphagus antarcticus]|uniref:Uncharacterized protein n=1 Tax=Algoriphagus antarcticus TaxID=238540 RepID=A0A3E0DCJ1_9BACT|nr:hypothetical protein C8N25_13048 [Algoriphagus antarcticus]